MISTLRDQSVQDNTSGVDRAAGTADIVQQHDGFGFTRAQIFALDPTDPSRAASRVYIEQPRAEASKPTVKQVLADIRKLFDYLTIRACQGGRLGLHGELDRSVKGDPGYRSHRRLPTLLTCFNHDQGTPENEKVVYPHACSDGTHEPRARRALFFGVKQTGGRAFITVTQESLKTKRWCAPCSTARPS